MWLTAMIRRSYFDPVEEAHPKLSNKVLPIYCRSLMEWRRHLAGMFSAPKRRARYPRTAGETPALPGMALAEQCVRNQFSGTGGRTRELSEETF